MVGEVVVHEPRVGERFCVTCRVEEVGRRVYDVSGVGLSGVLTLFLVGGEVDGYDWVSGVGFGEPGEDELQVVLDLFG